ncbi:hypothetical protein [Tenacibaculum retecalamus]|uniref:hypothetical protein n=1 Tax=Tenacibaculum retecalamus TaxID=3018315 RepID=UPI0023D95237|nr:hypothetical protein [Tenacibaculum retecalamus]WBX70537.1 hypothetical protein PG912_09720 [Tenacibaculum retecalamus]
MELSEEDLNKLIDETFKSIQDSKQPERDDNAENTSFAEKEEKNWTSLDQLENEYKSLENKRYKDDTAHRKVLSTWAGTLVSFWLVCVLLILTSNTNKFKLSDSVLIALLGTTTLNVLGLMVIVLNDLFNKSK